MGSRKSPLAERLLSNSPDPIKSSILRNSGMGWTPGSSSARTPAPGTGLVTSPLRISKRDTPAKPGEVIVARRSSNSYKHVHSNNLVSKSPFKSATPVQTAPPRPTSVVFPARRCSGEKRQRPLSLHEQGENENDRPLALKRERMQSQAFQGMLQKEPVSKSPFRRLGDSATEDSGRRSVSPFTHSNIARPPTPAESVDSRPTTPVAPQSKPPSPPPSLPPSRPETPPSTLRPAASTPQSRSPARSALVSRRMHGPRSSGGPKRIERKVTFHDRCDVLEFEADESEGDTLNTEDGACTNESTPDVSIDTAAEHQSVEGQILGDVIIDGGPSYESLQPRGPSLIDENASITGIVDELLSATGATPFSDDFGLVSGACTPPHHGDLPTDLETEDGVPFGRSHHVERFLQHQLDHPTSHDSPPIHFSPHASPLQSSPRTRSPSRFPLGLGRPSTMGSTSTPPRRSPALHHSTPPLGRSTPTHGKPQEEEQSEEEDDDELNGFAGNPLPIRREPRRSLQEDSITHKVDLSIRNELDIEDENSSFHLGFMNGSRLEERSISSDEDTEEVLRALNPSPGPRLSLQPADRSPAPRSSEPSPRVDLERIPKPFASPTSRSASPSLSTGISSRGQSPLTLNRDRIARDDIQRRLHDLVDASSSPASQRRSQAPSPEPIPSALNASPLHTPIQETLELPEKERDGASVLTTQTDFSTETAIIETAEKRTFTFTALQDVEEKASGNEFGLLNPQDKLHFDLGSKFSLGGLKLDMDFDRPVDTKPQRETFSAPVLRSRCAETSTSSGVRMGAVDVDMDMKSALDRLMEDVAGAGGRPDESLEPEDYSEDYECSEDQATEEDIDISAASRPRVMQRAATDSVLLPNLEANGIVSRSVSSASTASGLPPPLPPKDNIRTREQLIIERRREARRTEDDGYGLAKSNSGSRLSHKRSMSTGDVEYLTGKKNQVDKLLGVAEEQPGADDDLKSSIERELLKLSVTETKSKYHVRERATTIIASSSEDKVNHSAGGGDVDSGRAWRAVRRPSDMNEYAKEIREYRNQDKGKAYGKVFVKVLGVRNIVLPLPHEKTAISCTLNNGIHFVTTPDCELGHTAQIDQEFELIEHSKLEFTLTLKVRRDPHIMEQYKALAAPAPAPAVAPPPPVPQPASKSSKRGFWSSSPRRSAKEKIAAQPPPPPQTRSTPHRLPENLARHLKPDGTMARAFVSFKDVANRCDSRLFEISYPLIGQRVEPGGKFSTLEVGEIVLQMFRLPPLPGVPQDQLPQSLDECIRGLRHINWHKVTYFQGTLTQSGGDCNTWRRRQLRVIGSNLVAFNDVTKRATSTIDLKKAIAVEDDQDTSRDDDILYGVERSFRLIFPNDVEIVFFADTDDEKAKWLEVFRALVGHIPPHPLWAELLWTRQDEISQRMAAAQHQL